MKVKAADIQNKDFNLQVGFTVKEAGEQEQEVIVIEGFGNYFGKSSGDDYSMVYIDRAGEVVVPSGMDIKAYKKNPVILLNHDRSHVIGKAVSVSKKDEGIFIKAEIHKGACEDEVFYAIKNGLISTFSIGFRVKAGEYKEIDKNNVFFITRSELYECSCVTIPCNAESTFAVVKAFGEEGFYAGEFEADATTEGPTTGSVDINKQAEEETMKLALADMLPAAEVEKLKALGVDVAEEKEVSLKRYIDIVVERPSRQLLQLKPKVKAKLKVKLKLKVKAKLLKKAKLKLKVKAKLKAKPSRRKEKKPPKWSPSPLRPFRIWSPNSRLRLS
jgi:HK97 family phage prohead protease